MLSFFPRGVLDEILNLIESFSEGFPSYSWYKVTMVFGSFEIGPNSWLNYPLAQQSCGGDIGSVPYVCTFVCSPFVIAQATSFIIQF